MLKKNAQFFKSLFFISGLFIISLAWILSYVLRFEAEFIRPPILGIPPFSTHLHYLIPLLILWGLISNKTQLYRPRRIGHLLKEFFEVARCLTFALFLTIVIIYLFRRFEFSRLAFFYFWVMGIAGLISVRLLARETFRMLRKRGYNRRFAIIAGTGTLGQKVLEKTGLYPELGIQVIGFLTSKEEEIGGKIENIPILGLYEDLDKILGRRVVDICFVALSINEYDRFEGLIDNVQGYIPDVKVIPASYEFLKLRGGLDELGGLPMVSLQSSPLYGWNAVVKRAFDLILGTMILIMMSPILFIISLLIRLTSEGPIFYRQERVGMDGRIFQMLKFRTMKVDAERKTGPVWAKENDPRRTPIGAILRKTSMDELPQLFNVLKGEMSLVGPRPERPNFIEEFRNKIPLYMLRHKVKAGMTGWAQVHGWRGNTSLEKRLEHDLYYIQHWSIGLDLKILLMTLWKGFFNKSAY
jgi:Undecaprenyl-phosphate glucose phosphotransferase